MRRSVSEKIEIIRIVEGSELSVKRTLKELGISRSTFYEWYKRYLQEGYEGLQPKDVKRLSFWNRIPQKERSKVIETALERPDLSPREDSASHNRYSKMVRKRIKCLQNFEGTRFGNQSGLDRHVSSG
jgi:transposase-like protein